MDALSQLKPLAGICSYPEASKKGIGIASSVELLHRYLYVEKELNRIMLAHLNGVPEWEVKGAFSLHIWQDAEHCDWLRTRVSEMRTPPLNLDKIPDSDLPLFFAELLRSRNTIELLTGIYKVIKPSIVEEMKRYIGEANPIADFPSIRILRFILSEDEPQVEWGLHTLESLERTEEPQSFRSIKEWEHYLRNVLHAAGDIRGENKQTLPGPMRSAQTFKPDRIPSRDGRFTKVWNSRGKPPKEGSDTAEKNLYNLYVRLTEMHVPELMALIIYDWPDLTWEHYHKMTRHLWDEARHSFMGEVGFKTRNADIFNVPHEISFAEFPNRNFDPQLRYLLLWGIEQELMKPTGKKYQFEVAQNANDDLSATFHDFDWADELLHAQIGKKILTEHYSSMKEMNEQFQFIFQQYKQELQKDQDLDRSEWWEAFYKSVKSANQI